MFSFIMPTLIKIIGSINWGGNSYKLTSEELEDIRKKLTVDYYIILTRHDGHLSTFFVCLAHKVLTGKWGFYTHSLMNLEDTVTSDFDFRLVEANGTGVHYSYFMDIFGCDSVALLRPRHMTLDKWTFILDKMKTNIGKPYDSLFDLSQDKSFSCVSLIRNVLMNEPNYYNDYSNFEALVQKSKNLDPNMLYDCPDFIIEYERRHR